MPKTRKECRPETVLRYTTKDGYTGAIVKLRTVEVPIEEETQSPAEPKNKTRRRIR